MSQTEFPFEDPIADIRPIVANELARDAVVIGVARQRYAIIALAKWNRERWIVDIGPRRVLCKHVDSPTSSCHPTAAYAGIFEAAA